MGADRKMEAKALRVLCQRGPMYSRRIARLIGEKIGSVNHAMRDAMWAGRTTQEKFRGRYDVVRGSDGYPTDEVFSYLALKGMALDRVECWRSDAPTPEPAPTPTPAPTRLVVEETSPEGHAQYDGDMVDRLVSKLLDRLEIPNDMPYLMRLAYALGRLED
jgi:hypothetical protein